MCERILTPFTSVLRSSIKVQITISDHANRALVFLANQNSLKEKSQYFFTLSEIKQISSYSHNMCVSTFDNVI